VEACFGPGSTYDGSMREKLMCHLNNPESQSIPWPEAVTACFPRVAPTGLEGGVRLYGTPMLAQHAGLKKYWHCMERMIHEIEDLPLPHWKKDKEWQKLRGSERVTWQVFQKDHEKANKLQAEEESQVTWVQCEHVQCRKWRKLPGGIEESEIPEEFFCNMNKWDPSRNRCTAPQEETGEQEETVNWTVDVQEDKIAVQDLVDAYCSRDSQWYEATVSEVNKGHSLRVQFQTAAEKKPYEELILWVDIGRRVAMLNSKSCLQGVRGMPVESSSTQPAGGSEQAGDRREVDCAVDVTERQAEDGREQQQTVDGREAEDWKEQQQAVDGREQQEVEESRAGQAVDDDETSRDIYGFSHAAPIVVNEVF